MFYFTAEEEDMLVKQQEGSLLARQKMFVQLRQDLERVSILSPKPISSRPFCWGKRPIYWCVIPNSCKIFSRLNSRPSSLIEITKKFTLST